MRKEEIIDILLDWNFWKKEPNTGINREGYVEKAKRFLKTNMILGITGVRRSGKSFIMRQIAKALVGEGLDPRETLIVNLEDKRLTGCSIKSLDEIFDAYLDYVNPKSLPHIFIDEVHLVKGWERWARTMNELQTAKLVVSGSTSELISQELGTVLTGRHLDIKVFPLGFGEFLKFKNIEVKDRLELLNKKIELMRLFREYLQHGGFPEVILSGDETTKTDILVSYFDDILTKDIVRRFGIKKIGRLEALAKFYLSNVSNSITFRSAGRGLGGMNKDTVEKYSRYMEKAFLLFFIRRFSRSFKEQENSPRKVYSIDTGLSSAVSVRFSENFGKLMENVVAIELLRRAARNPLLEIYYWKDQSGKEVDFVIKEGPQVNKLVQVCRDMSNPETKKRETHNLASAMDEFKLQEGIILTEDFESEESVKGKKIKYRPLWKWLLEGVNF